MSYILFVLNNKNTKERKHFHKRCTRDADRNDQSSVNVPSGTESFGLYRALFFLVILFLTATVTHFLVPLFHSWCCSQICDRLQPQEVQKP